MKKEKKSIIPLMSVLIVVVFVIIGLGFLPGIGCACVGSLSAKESMQIELKYTEKEIREQKEKNGKYPEYEKLNEIMSRRGYDIKKYEERGSREAGLFYSVSPEGNKFELGGYAAQEWFGIGLPMVFKIN